MSDMYRDRFELGEIAINISLVDEDDGVHVTVWPTFDNPDTLPPGLQDTITGWCCTRQAQDWALAQEPLAAARSREPGD